MIQFARDNGGPTRTHALLPGSPAIDAGNPTLEFDPNEFDQRGVPFFRVSNGRVDIGAFELGPVTIVVNDVGDFDDEDSGNQITTLREAIDLANNNPGDDTIVFDDSVFSVQRTISLASQIRISDGLSIVGPGAASLTLDAGNGADNQANTGDGFRIFEIVDFIDDIEVSISGLTLTGGDVAGTGGAIDNRENLTLVNSLIDENSADASGGGINNSGKLTVTGSTFFGNTAANGGGIFNSGSDVLSVSNSTFSTNTTASSGGGGGIYQTGSSLVINNSTFYQNSAGSLGGGGIFDNLTNGITLNNTIVAANTSNLNSDDISGTVAGSFNLIGDADSAGGMVNGSNGNLVGIDPLLGAIGDNGGQTLTHAPLPSSPAIDAGDPLAFQPPEFDQRGIGFPRVNSGRLDIGAIEFATVEAPKVVSVTFDDGPIQSRPDLLSTIMVVFDADVSIAAGDLQLLNDSTGGNAVDLSGIGFSYNASTFTATWNFDTLDPLNAAFYTYVLEANSITSGGLALDGNGDGTAGDDFMDQHYVALPGDANLDGTVDVLGDAFALIGNLGQTGDVAYALGDFNADGNIDVLGDAFILIGRLGQSVVPPALSTSSSSSISSRFETNSSETVNPTEALRRDIVFVADDLWDNQQDEQNDKLKKRSALRANNREAQLSADLAESTLS